MEFLYDVPTRFISCGISFFLYFSLSFFCIYVHVIYFSRSSSLPKRLLSTEADNSLITYIGIYSHWFLSSQTKRTEYLTAQ